MHTSQRKSISSHIICGSLLDTEDSDISWTKTLTCTHQLSNYSQFFFPQVSCQCTDCKLIRGWVGMSPSARVWRLSRATAIHQHTNPAVEDSGSVLHHNWNPHWENDQICCFCRFRPTQTKAKKTKTETKLEFFGFEDKEEEEGEEGPEGGASGKSSYKIKYFGFDDLSESDSEDESCQVKEKKARKAAAALASLSSSVDSPHTSDSQDSQASSNTGEFFLFLTYHITPSLPFFLYRCPLCHLQFDFSQMPSIFVRNPVLEPPRDKKDARENQVISPKTLALGWKRSSVDLKRYQRVSLSLYTEVMMSGYHLCEWPSLWSTAIWSCWDGHLLLFIDVSISLTSGQFAYINQAVGGEGQRGKIVH